MTSVFGVTGMFDSLLTLYLSEGMMIFTAVLLIAAIIAFIKGKGRRALRVGCVVVGIYCILYLGAIIVLSSLFASNHEPPQPEPPRPALIYLGDVEYAEVREMNKDNAKEVTLYPYKDDNVTYEETISNLTSALNAITPSEKEQEYDKNAMLYDVVFKFENGAALNATIGENLIYIPTVGFFETTKNVITACEMALTSPDLVLDVVSYMKSVSASDFKEPKEYGTISDQALADALNGAVKNLMSNDCVPSPFVDQWAIRWVFLEGSPTGATNKDLHLSISCGLTENVVEVVVRKGQQENSAYFEDAVLYQLVRHSRDYEEIIDADAYEQVKEELTMKMVSTVEQMKENPLEATGYELTQLEKILDFTANEFETLKLYRYRYAITVAHPERDGWAGGMYLDSELRVQDGYHWAGYVALLENSGSGVVEKLWYDSDYCFDDGAVETDTSDFEEQLRRWAEKTINETPLGD